MLYVGQRQHDVDFLLGEHAVRGRESTTHVPRPPRSTLTDRHQELCDAAKRKKVTGARNPNCILDR